MHPEDHHLVSRGFPSDDNGDPEGWHCLVQARY